MTSGPSSTRKVVYPGMGVTIRILVPKRERLLFAEWLRSLPCNYGREQLAQMILGEDGSQ